MSGRSLVAFLNSQNWLREVNRYLPTDPAAPGAEPKTEKRRKRSKRSRRH